MSNLLLRIADRVINRPLMILPEKLSIISSVLEGRLGVEADADGAAAINPGLRQMLNGRPAARGNPQGPKPYQMAGDVALIAVHGSLVNRGAWLGASSGMTSYEGIKHQLATAAADPDVVAIVLDMDSPGGEAGGAFEAADAVREAALKKPVTAVVDGMAASAAYLIASGATKIVTTQSGVLGSIGVVMMHADYSQRMQKVGIQATFIYAGKHKIDGNAFQPLEDETKSNLQKEVDGIFGMLVTSVSSHRPSLTQKLIRAQEARVYTGQAAIDAKLADEVGTLQTALASLAAAGPRSLLPPTSRTSLALSAPADAASAERARIEAIIGLPEARGQEGCARFLAFSTSESVESAKAALAAFALDAPPPPAVTLKRGAPMKGATYNQALGLYLCDGTEATPGRTCLVEGGSAAADSVSDAWAKVAAKINSRIP